MTIRTDGLTVALFATCINDVMFPGTPRAVVELLERLGCRVEFPMEQTCCGQMFTNTGYFDAAVPNVRNYVKAFSGYEYVVGPSGSCVGAVRHQHPMLADHAKDAGLAAEVDRVVARTYDLSEFLVDVLGITDVGAYFPHRVTYHPTCHSLRMLRVGDKPLKLLRAVDAIDLVELPEADACCGFGGTFAIKNAEVSRAMVTDKTRHIKETEAEFVTGGDSSCLMNIGGALSRQRSGVRAVHMAEILASTKEHPWTPTSAAYSKETML